MSLTEHQSAKCCGGAGSWESARPQGGSLKGQMSCPQAGTSRGLSGQEARVTTPTPTTPSGLQGTALCPGSGWAGWTEKGMCEVTGPHRKVSGRELLEAPALPGRRTVAL